MCMPGKNSINDYNKCPCGYLDEGIFKAEINPIWKKVIISSYSKFCLKNWF